MKKIKSLAIANRGEVAVRIIRACQDMGIRSILLHSEVDRQSLAYRLCDQAVCIGESPANKSYLNIAANIEAARNAGADAVHPGFGFLSENAEFAEACQRAGLIFVGPSAEAISLLGDKIQAKNLAEKQGVPTIPDYRGEDQSHSRLVSEAEKIGYPVMIKAAGGGGGRGLKVIRGKKEAEEQIISAQREAEAAFGSKFLFLEKYLDRAKHIEFQVFGDTSGKVIDLLDRECSVQRRHQKIIEEALSASLTEELRTQMGEAARKIAQAANYSNAGTVEFLLQDGRFYFLEMNTRLQVEHPVTEEVLGIDLVKAQIQVAQGEPLPWAERPQPRGHAIEARLYAENSYQNGMPSTGVLGSCHWPHGRGRRFEVGFVEGDEISTFYDSMIAKVIVWDENREAALQKLRHVLDDIIIFGVHTNIPYLKAIIEHPEFQAAKMTTRFIDENFAEGLTEPALSKRALELSRDIYNRIHETSSAPSTDQTRLSIWQHHWRNV